MKKIILIILLVVGGLGSYVLYKLYGSATNFNETSKSIILKEESIAKEKLIATLVAENIIKDESSFKQLGDRMKIWDKVKPGKFKFNNGENLLSICRKFRSNNQQELNLIINKIRTPQELAKLIGKGFSTDSATAYQIITDKEVLTEFNTSYDSLFFNIIPNTYQFFYNTPVQKMLEKLTSESKKFWNSTRTEKANKLGLTPNQIYVVASIVEEETNKDDEKGKVASVYLNRVSKGMKLEADPTVKFALKDFTLKRILFKHLEAVSPYNTYRNVGLPPGAICTPSIKTIDAVLEAPATDYLFFCADISFNGYHHFTTNYQEHSQYAKQYQAALTVYLAEKAKQKK